MISYWIILFAILLLSLTWKYRDRDRYRVWDFAKIRNAIPYLQVRPKTEEEIKEVILKYPNHKISIAGGKFSHGGQTFLNNAIYIDLQDYNKILDFDLKKKEITVESGTTWDQIQQFLDRYNLSVLEMQSYRNFSVGGSISINAHGRGLECGTVGDSVVKMDLMTSDGKTHNNVKPNSTLGRVVIGGYGGIAIILKVCLKVTDNYKIERRVTITPTTDNSCYKILKEVEYEAENSKSSNLVFYNGNIYPKAEQKVVNVYWFKTNKPVTKKERLQPHNKLYLWDIFLEQILRRTNSLKYLRAYFEPEIWRDKKEVVWRNYEMSYDTASLEPFYRYPTTTILQEYFVPPEAVENFLKEFWEIINKYNVNLLNVSLRYVKKTDLPVLNFAPSNRIAVVLYLNIGNNKTSLDYGKYWTRLLIDLVNQYGGTYYLPYLPFATLSQFRLSYPNWHDYLEFKKRYDPKLRLSNEFLEKYILNNS